MAARRFPWNREEAEDILRKIEIINRELNGLAATYQDLPEDDDYDIDGMARRYKRRMIQSVAEATSEASDVCDAIYSKFPDLAPDNLKEFYPA